MRRWLRVLLLLVAVFLAIRFAAVLIRGMLVLFVVAFLSAPVLRWYLRRKFAARTPPAPPSKVIDAEYEIR